ncbi:PolC-type DNA polymerase III [Paenibacillus sp. HJGM_3]|uniref:3'-5' exonuclease n=1 Tax=Paenibacillus sp. HJGM_3 TaxID=3379816 RepID=UPI00385E987A
MGDLHSRTFCVFDLEGTGIDYETDHITQIGAVLLQDGEVVRRFSSLVRSPVRIPEAIERLTGIKNAELESAPDFPEVYARFLEFSAGAVLVTQAGYEYDVHMLERHCGRYGIPWKPQPVIDTKALYASIHPEITDIISTNYLLRTYQIDDRDVPRHDALGDSILISRFFRAILEEYRALGHADWTVREGLRVKRFQLPPLGG